MAEALLSRRAGPRRWRLQFSLASIFILTTLSAIGTWFWYHWPYAVENKEYDSGGRDPFAPPGTPPAAPSLIRREVEYVRRVWGGKTVRHGSRHVYDANDNLRASEHYRNGQPDGEFITYGSTGN